MRLNHATLRHEMESQRRRVTDLAEELGIARTHLSNIVNGNRPATPEIIQGLAKALNLNPYNLLGPEDPKAAVKELVELYDLTAEELFDLGKPRHAEAAA